MKRPSSAAIDWSKVTVEDLAANPHRFGLPTFQEYQAARHKWNPSMDADSAMVAISDGPQRFRRDLNKIKYQVNGEDVLEDHVERALGNHGFTLADIDLENRNSKLKKEINMVPLGGGKFDLVVNFKP